MPGAAGLILGCPVAAATLAMWIFMRLGQISFWPTCRRLTRSLLSTVDARDFRMLYGELLLLLGRYLARNVLLMAGASLPVVLFVLFVAPAANVGSHWGTTGDARQRSGFPMFGLDEPVCRWACDPSPGNGPEVIFYAGLSLASSAGVVLLRMRSR